jgi:hypothetical protein
MHTILTGGRGRRKTLALAISTVALAIGLMGITAGTASAQTCDKAAAIHVDSYTIVGTITPGTRTVTSLRGNVNEGDTITANFTVNPLCANVTVNFPSYNAPTDTWQPGQATNQSVFDFSDGTQITGRTFSGSGNAVHTSTPPGCFQVDLVVGGIIGTLDPTIGATYGQQGRLVDADNGDAGCMPLF